MSHNPQPIPIAIGTHNVIIKAENISKQYRLGKVGTGTIKHDLNRWWHSLIGKEDPYLKIGEANDRSVKGESDYVWALQDINFEIAKGEVVGIIGKNGAGKSTLLKILSRVTSPTTGSVKFGGRVASLLEVGTGFNGEMTGRENIFLNGAILGMTKKEIASKLDEIIEFSGCERYIDTPVKRYSSGMYVRLAFAVAAFLEPEILIVDEVLAVGDAEFQKKAIGKMQDISRGEGRTVLFVSHNMAAVKSLCTRGIVLEQGRVVFEGQTDDCINRYLSLSQKNEFDFYDFTNRSGKGEIRIVGLNVFDIRQKEIKLSELKSGSDYYFKLKIQNFTKDEKKIDIGISVFSNNGQLLTASGSRWFLEQMMLKSDEIKDVTLYIQCFPFTGGNYILNLSCKSNFVDLEDFIKDSIVFEVENITKTKTNGTHFPREMILINHKWYE